MNSLFADLTAAVEGTPLVAFAAALSWGVLSVLLSPCHLASIPLVVGFIQGRGETTPRRAALLATLFAIGILVAIAAIGVATAAVGRMLGDVGSWGNVLVAAVFVLVGLALADVLPLGWATPDGAGSSRFAGRGPGAALGLGLVFGVALGPCTFAFMAPLLAVTFRVAAEDMLFGVLLLVAYGIGHSLVIVAAGSSVVWTQRVLDWNAGSPAGRVIKRVCGVLVIGAGVYLLYTAR